MHTRRTPTMSLTRYEFSFTHVHWALSEFSQSSWLFGALGSMDGNIYAHGIMLVCTCICVRACMYEDVRKYIYVRKCTCTCICGHVVALSKRVRTLSSARLLRRTGEHIDKQSVKQYQHFNNTYWKIDYVCGYDNWNIFSTPHNTTAPHAGQTARQASPKHIYSGGQIYTKYKYSFIKISISFIG